MVEAEAELEFYELKVTGYESGVHHYTPDRSKGVVPTGVSSAMLTESMQQLARSSSQCSGASMVNCSLTLSHTSRPSKPSLCQPVEEVHDPVK